MSASLAPPRTRSAHAAPTTTTAATPAPANRWYTLAVLCLSLLVIVVDTTIVNVALPTLAKDLHAPASGLQWIVDAYTLTFAAILLLAGTLADKYGRHHALRAGLITFAAASLAATAHRIPAAAVAPLLHTAHTAFIAGADRAALTAAVATALGAAVAHRALRFR